MKKSKLLGLGIILSVIGLTGLINITAGINWYVEHVSSDIAFILCLMLSILMAIGGFICIFAALDGE